MNISESKSKDNETISSLNENESNNTGSHESIKTSYLSQCASVPEALPQGWFVKSSRSQPDYQYYFHGETGKVQWEKPVINSTPSLFSNKSKLMIDTDQLISNHRPRSIDSFHASNDHSNTKSADKLSLKKDKALFMEAPSNTTTGGGSAKTSSSTAPPSSTNAAAPSGILKRKSAYSNPNNTQPTTNNKNIASVSSSSLTGSRKNKRARSSGNHPKEVRVLHLLKKHNKSRRPASWRSKNKPITITKDEAIQELQELLGMLKEVEDDSKELRATFEELAKTESDCSSSKRGGDLGFFGKSTYISLLMHLLIKFNFFFNTSEIFLVT